MTEHRAEVFRDDTAAVGHPFAWRSRCTCMAADAGPPGRGWAPSWNAHCWEGAYAVARAHVADPRPDDWLNLTWEPAVPGVYRRGTGPESHRLVGVSPSSMANVERSRPWRS